MLSNRFQHLKVQHLKFSAFIVQKYFFGLKLLSLSKGPLVYQLCACIRCTMGLKCFIIIHFLPTRSEVSGTFNQWPLILSCFIFFLHDFTHLSIMPAESKFATQHSESRVLLWVAYSICQYLVVINKVARRYKWVFCNSFIIEKTNFFWSNQYSQ